MGVTGLWQIVQPCARPIKIETLNRKRLAVDASIWIYQFLKAVRDKEGNALRNSHVVGFFRRICKLLFFGIKPVFVFDGGAPTLKRQTISSRKARREGRREDAVRTAGKLLAVQMQRRAEEEETRRKAERDRPAEAEEEVPDEGLVYVDELQMSQKERQQNRKFRKTDQYHLPDLDISMAEMGGPNDPRIMSLEELQAYARQFDTGEDINVYDFSKIDYDSPFFTSLPPSDRYNILNAARLRSRLRMGHSKEQLDQMFPDRMAFSKFQIERVQERNELTQRLMHLNGFEGTTFGANGSGRIAGEKGREYVLIRNDGVEGGWALGVINDEGKQERPIDLDRPEQVVKDEDNAEWEDDGFEDVPIEGLNRLPKVRKQDDGLDRLMKQRRALYQSRKKGAKRSPKRARIDEDADSLFVHDSDGDVEEQSEADAEEDPNVASEDEDLQKAIAMSLGKDQIEHSATQSEAEDNGDMLEIFHQAAAPEAKPVPKGSGRSIANLVNKRAYEAAPESREITSFGVPTMKPDESDGEDGMDFQAALAESRRNKRKAKALAPRTASTSKTVDSASDIAKKAGFSGPLPFEKLDLGTSLLGRKKMQERSEEAAGGFENPVLANEQKKTEPVPPWFVGDVEKDLDAQKAIEREDRQKARDFSKKFRFQKTVGGTLRRGDSDQVIDLEADDTETRLRDDEVIDLEANDGHDMNAGIPLVDDIRMNDLADKIRAEPPERGDSIALVDDMHTSAITSLSNTADSSNTIQSSPAAASKTQTVVDATQIDKSDEIDWSDSDIERAPSTSSKRRAHAQSEQQDSHTLNVDDREPRSPRSPSVEFEDIAITGVTRDATASNSPAVQANYNFGIEDASLEQVPMVDIIENEEYDDFSDPEELEMLKALTMEAEEHARFASSLNNKSQAQNIREYEQELKQLRNQQKKDRRDADEVTHIMVTECQQLLRLFGLPYVTAPMEAEAQCAELVRLGLVDGIVTDDSDCFLFGGTRIYKNMFNQAKFVECYLSGDLEKEFDLTRDKMISVAHLLGSDYTEGLPGVGPVTALEILSEFQDLENFKTWWSGVQMNQISKAEDVDKPFRKKFRRNASKLFLPTGFPDARVAMAYLNPEVDSDPEAFQWGVPDLDALRSFLMATIGWSQERTDEVLVPVIKDMNRRMDEGTQANITAFFDGTVGVGAAGNSSAARGEGFAPRKRAEGSKRMGNALKRMADRARTTRSDSTADEGKVSVDANVSTHDDPQGVAVDRHANSKELRQSRKRPASNQANESDLSETTDNEDTDFAAGRTRSKRSRVADRASRPRKQRNAAPDTGL